MNLDGLLEMSRRYGADGKYVLAGGGNTSCKEDGAMYVKGSGSHLSDVTAEDFVGVDTAKLHRLADMVFPDNTSDDSREETVLREMMAARLPGSEAKRPSVESMLHALFPYKYVLHVHPALVNGLTCGQDGRDICFDIFGNDAVWIQSARPGFMLASACKKAFAGYIENTGSCPQLALLQNHGIFIAAGSVPEIDAIMADVWQKLAERIDAEPDFDAVSYDREKASSAVATLRTLCADGGSGGSGGRNGPAAVLFCANRQALEYTASAEAFRDVAKPFTPDHIIYCNGEPLFVGDGADIAGAYAAHRHRKMYSPKIVAVQGLGFFALGKTEKEADMAQELFLNAMKIAVYAQSFGGPLPMTDELAGSIIGYKTEISN